MFQKALAVTGINKRNIQNLGVFQRLLHAVAQRFIAALGFNNRQRCAPVRRGQDIVGLLLLATAGDFAAHRNPSVGKAILHKNLFFRPTCRFNGGSDMAVFNVFFAKSRHGIILVKIRLISNGAILQNFCQYGVGALQNIMVPKT